MPPAPSPRIPQALQDVFVASNEGKEVHAAPPEGEASKVYLRNWIHQAKSDSSRSNDSCRSLLGSSQEKLKSLMRNIPDTPRTAGRKTRRPSFKERSQTAPQALLNEQMQYRGYPTDTYNTLQTAYYSPPNPLQRASYGPHMIRLVKDGNAEGLKDSLAAGLSPNPCNQFGESLVHMACRRGDIEIVRVLLEAGASVQVADDYGRTPLHDACWAAQPAFDVVEALLRIDNRLFYMKDCRGSLPLSYVHKDHYAEWESFLGDASFLDQCFPKREFSDEAPELCKLWPNARPLPDPKDALPLQIAMLVANGKASPDEARILNGDSSSTVADDESDFDSEDDSDFESDYDTEDEDDDDEHDDDDELDEEIVQLANMRFS